MLCKLCDEFLFLQNSMRNILQEKLEYVSKVNQLQVSVCVCVG